MKKIFAILMVLAVAGSFVSCNKNDNPSKDKTLSGTSWVGNPEEDITLTIAFTTKTECQISASITTDVIKGTYIYNDPNISITANDMESGQSKTVRGNIDGNEMTLTDPDDASVTIVLTKK